MRGQDPQPRGSWPLSSRRPDVGERTKHVPAEHLHDLFVAESIADEPRRDVMESLAGILKSVHVLHDRVFRTGRRRVPEQTREGTVQAKVVSVEGVGTATDV